ncbi:exonuclease domain-containing protein, partial [Legionella sp.]|uniref:exonuclease domain-containing protein n=1 Tax=Legionella sp. TaxID=459 RepID=UPI003D0DBBA2
QWKKKLEEYCDVFDTLIYARDKFPGQRNSLDALCKRFGIDHFNREFHGALLDAEILAFVYLALTGGQSSLFGEAEETANKNEVQVQEIASLRLANPIVVQALADEIESHQSFIEFLSKKSGINHWEEV